MKKTIEQHQIDLLLSKIEILEHKQNILYNYARNIGDNYANSNEVWSLKQRIKVLEQSNVKEPKYYNPFGWSFHASFVPALLIIILILLMIISNKMF